MAVKLENRIAALEEQVARLQKRQDANPGDARAWVDDLYGTFAADPVFEEAMKLGRKYRQSLRRRAGKSKRK